MEAYVETKLVRIHVDVNKTLTDFDRIHEIRSYLMKLAPDLDFYITIERNKVLSFLIENALLKRPFSKVAETVLSLTEQVPEAILEIFTENRLSVGSTDRNILIERDRLGTELDRFLSAMERMDTFGIEIPRDEGPDDENVGEAAAEGVVVLEAVPEVILVYGKPATEEQIRWLNMRLEDAGLGPKYVRALHDNDIEFVGDFVQTEWDRLCQSISSEARNLFSRKLAGVGLRKLRTTSFYPISGWKRPSD